MSIKNLYISNFQLQLLLISFILKLGVKYKLKYF